ncbi:coiled-coil domain-containing protein 158-like isoform X3 [Corythoichthys intestinalis]|uniref:coiled-coil domain-containing protein 158-like isoform X3 n=1 Tax=Corythoichthys intestinalis TaxID=161448 RepID=UPI0025A6783D|nr:coiled-coil domain-containing protein 158-like isoform X3 [Corythoichthys intestinalis]
MDLRREGAGSHSKDVSRLRFNSLVLNELSEELEKCTQETQRLQEEVEQATKAALEKFGKCNSVASSNDSARQQGQSATSRTRKKTQKTALHLQHAPTHIHKTKLQQIQIERESTSNLRMEELITSVGQEVAILNRKLGSSKNSGARINAKLELLRTSLQQQLMTFDLKQSPGGARERAQTEEIHRQTQRSVELDDRDQLVAIPTRQLEKSKQTINRLHQENALSEHHGATPTLGLKSTRTLEKLDQELTYQNVRSQRQAQELALVRKEKTQLARQLEAIRSKDKHLRERIDQLEAIFNKMSEGFANCQDFIQLKEQEFLRLQLKHILDLKFQGANGTPPGLDSMIPEPADPGPSEESHGRNHAGSHTNNATLRRRSVPERTHRPAFEEAKVTRRRTTCGSGTTDSPHSGQLGSSLMTAKRNTFYTRWTSGRGSPVYALLTSEPGHT